MKIVSDFGKFFWIKLENIGNKIFTPAYNPFYFLGGIAFHLLYVLFITGAYLLLFYDISPTGSYKSMESLMKEQPYIGGIMRSIHRYATDGLMVTLGLHLLREFFKYRYRFYRWVAWVSGVGLLFSIWITGLIGYWMLWDSKAQVIALFISEMLDYLIFLSEPMSMSFLAPSSMTNLFFFVILFFHVSVPSFLLFVAWLHYSRTSKPRVNPPALLSIGILALLAGLAYLNPATIDEPANLAKISEKINVDWFLMVFFPVMAKSGPQAVWAVIGGIFLFLFILPWIPGRKRPPTAEIILEKCTGCRACRDDCPYEAIIIRKRTDGKPYEFEAKISANRCSGCGICLGACDYNAVRLASVTNEGLAEVVGGMLSSVKKTEGNPTVMAFVCEKGPRIEGVLDSSGRTVKDLPGVKTLSLPCLGMINPSLIERALDEEADGVFICGCGKNDCYYRLGNLWLADRLSGTRPPSLKKQVDQARIRTFFEPAIQGEDFLREAGKFQEDLKTRKIEKKPSYAYRIAMIIPAVLSLSIPVLLIWALSSVPTSLFEPGKAMLKVGFKHKTPRTHQCTDEEVRAFHGSIVTELPGSKKISRHMEFTPRGESPYCGKRERNSAYVEISLDGKPLYGDNLRPTGWHRDGAIFLYQRFLVEPGEHKVVVKLRDTNRKEGFDYEFEDLIGFEKSGVRALTFEKSINGFKWKP
ncbi:MAG: hydrogenase iron-sulfur subunit [Nitrospinae bacterium]|nr:hydrogenase iron-sulfur subunit [Nitrospinota bacterium]